MFHLHLVLFAFLLLLCFRKWSRWQKMPPGPWGWAIVGSAFSVSVRRPWDSYSKLARKFGGIMSVSMSMSAEDIIISDYDLALEFFNREEFVPRPPLVPFLLSQKEGGHEGSGIAWSNGKTWQENRRFTLRTLRDFGFGKTSLNDFIMADLNAFVAKIDTGGQPVDLKSQLNLAILNIVWRMVGSKQQAILNIVWRMVGNESFDLDNPVLLKLVGAITKLVNARGKDSIMKLLALRRFPQFFAWWFGVSKSVMEIDVFLKETVKKHKLTLDENYNRDFIDSYLQEMKTQEPGSVINEGNLLACVRHLFSAGSETTATTIRWGLLFLIMFSEIQEKAQDELDQIVGKDRDVHLDDRKNLHYNEALILEILRYGNTVPLSMSHSCSQDATFQGYLIPADCSIFINAVHMHRDSKYWKDPLKFDPSRFLDGEGHLRSGRIPGFVPFGIGKRQCPGEILARMELFLFMTNLLSRFTFSSVPGKPLPDLNTTFYGVVQQPPNYKLIVTERK